MKISVSRDDPYAIKDQIKRQIRVLIGSGELAAGSVLPSAKDMGALLNVNRNTISQVYKELAFEGLLEIVVGSGTFIKEGKMLKRCDELKMVLDESIERAKALGFSEEQISDFFLTHLTTYSAKSEGYRVLVVECNAETIEEICATISEELNVEAEGVLIQTLEDNPAEASRYLVGKNLIVCGFNHVEDFKRIVPETPVEMVAVLLRTDLRVINEMMQLPPGTRVGLICANQRSTETWVNNAFLSSGSTLIKICAGMDNPNEFEKMLDECDLIYASKYVYDRVIQFTGPDKRVVRVELTIDPATIDLIRERLGAAKQDP